MVYTHATVLDVLSEIQSDIDEKQERRLALLSVTQSFMLSQSSERLSDTCGILQIVCLMSNREPVSFFVSHLYRSGPTYIVRTTYCDAFIGHAML